MYHLLRLFWYDTLKVQWLYKGWTMLLLRMQKCVISGFKNVSTFLGKSRCDYGVVSNEGLITMVMDNDAAGAHWAVGVSWTLQITFGFWPFHTGRQQTLSHDNCRLSFIFSLVKTTCPPSSYYYLNSFFRSFQILINFKIQDHFVCIFLILSLLWK